jgi:hypothetical protein
VRTVSESVWVRGSVILFPVFSQAGINVQAQWQASLALENRFQYRDVAFDLALPSSTRAANFGMKSAASASSDSVNLNCHEIHRPDRIRQH